MKVYNVVQSQQFYKRRLVLLLTDLCLLCLSSHLPSFLQESVARSTEKDAGMKEARVTLHPQIFYLNVLSETCVYTNPESMDSLL